MQSDLENDDAELYTDELDPTFVNSRREACIIFAYGSSHFVGGVPFCYLNGYNVADPENIPITFGMPSWVVWGNCGAMDCGRRVHSLVLFLLYEKR